MLHGIVAVYKPKGPTSHDIVNAVRRITGEKRVGHAGTLDPLASGILVVGIGREATKKLTLVVNKEKEYVVTIKLGVTSTTGDEKGDKTSIKGLVVSIKEIQNVLTKYIGVISQVPPAYSAVKVDGKEAYKYARKGQEVELKPRNVLIKEIEVMAYSWPLLRLRVVTGPGVYIRALARDIGKSLGTGAYVSSLERTRVGEYTKETAVSIY